MAPTFDEDSSPVRLRSLWDAGQHLTTAAANLREVESALVAAQRAYEAALAARSAVLGSLAAVQSAYAAAHDNAVAVGWSTTELSDAGLPTPQARHSGPRGTERRPADPIAGVPRPTVSQKTGPQTTVSQQAISQQAISQSAVWQSAVPPTTVNAHRPDERSHWDAEQTAFLVTSRSKDNPVWYESMRQSPISPNGDDADLDGGARPEPDPAGSGDQSDGHRP